ncbi:membrane protein [Streptomyces longisporoflavus]|uniref:murein biosynthesis integral membrane protein MurJ n=1 Tax=Streptomyces longisporoflavus TaxID=28044 RepID=UPI00167DBD29|nr:lipid II flippase MurJ [Streptomyces longisporoflavus]GGV44793.1 membrane protein [Streptomyces longisporoflavus]
MTATAHAAGAGVVGQAGGPVAAGAVRSSDPSNGFLAKAALVTALLTVAGSVLGLVRDQALARFFGAGSETDAFLVAWTVPELATTLLIEDGLAFALVPAFSMALARRAEGAGRDPVRALVAASLPRLMLGTAALALILMAGAPVVVDALAPGLPDPRLAVDCTLLTATCVFTFGLAGYCSAALRAHRRFVAPAAIYVFYNIGIITAVFVLAPRYGVRAAAMGVAVGGVLMVLVQAPSLWRQLTRDTAADVPRDAEKGGSGPAPALMSSALIATVLLFALCRQSQVLIERFLASSLPSGAISHLNYAQKVAQVPMVLSLMLCTVTLPVVARALAEGDVKRARSRVERDLGLAGCMVLLGTAVVIACAPQLVQLLFQRGAFTARDTEATAAVMRVYALGLLGHTLVGALVRSYFSAGRPTWFPPAAMAAGIAATAGIGSWTVDLWGVRGIALANAAGISVTACVLLRGMGPRNVPIRVREVVGELAKPVAAAACATAAGWALAGLVGSPLVALAVGSPAVVVVFGFVLWVLKAQSFEPVRRTVMPKVGSAVTTAVSSATRKRTHVR